jgi:hypothetical protein
MFAVCIIFFNLHSYSFTINHLLPASHFLSDFVNFISYIYLFSSSCLIIFVTYVHFVSNNYRRTISSNAFDLFLSFPTCLLTFVFQCIIKLHSHINTYIHVYAYVYVYVYIYMCVCVSECIYIYIYTRAHAHTYTHTQTFNYMCLHTYYATCSVPV